MRNCNKIYVHCGLHKTGTTALQAALRKNEASLRQAGFLFPYSGSLSAAGSTKCRPADAGQHNIAWEITRDRRYSSRHGGLGMLRAEIAAFDGNIILSGEDFETILTAPDRFAPLRQLAEDSGRDLVLVLYLRNQMSYLELLFSQLLYTGMGEEYTQCANIALLTGAISCREWQFQFDYKVIVDLWDARSDATLIVRNYHELVDGSLMNDFARCIGLEPAMQLEPAMEQVNQRETIMRSVARFYRNRMERNLRPVEAARIRRLCQDLPSRLDSGPSLQGAFARRFNDDNIAICRRWDLPLSGLVIAETPEVQRRVSLAALFSFETQCAIRFGTIEQIASAAQTVLADLPITGMATLRPPAVRRRRKLKYLLNAVMEKAYFSDLEFFDI